MSASAPKEGKEALAAPKAASAEKPTGKEVNAIKNDTHDKAVAAATPATNEQHPDSVYETKPKDRFAYTPLPEKVTKEEFGTALGAAASIALPVHVGIPLVTTMATVALWKKMRKLPVLSSIDRGVRGIGNGVKNIAGKMWKTATYLPKTAATIGLNTAKFVPNAIGRTWQFGVNRFHDLWQKTPGESESVTERLWNTITDMPSKAVDILHSGINAGTKGIQYVFAHPIRSVIGATLLTGVITANGGPLLFSKNFATAFLQIFQGIAKMVGGAGAL